MQNILIVVDMQTDFVDGVLGSAEAVEIVPRVEKRIQQALASGERVIFTRDTHEEDYLTTREGKHLPVAHCVRNTPGWQILPALAKYTEEAEIFDKITFGSVPLMEKLAAENAVSPIAQITLTGVCTDICVISNAMLLKAALPETDIAVAADCCAGVTPESHRNALNAMQMCQIAIL